MFRRRERLHEERRRQHERARVEAVLRRLQPAYDGFRWFVRKQLRRYARRRDRMVYQSSYPNPRRTTYWAVWSLGVRVSLDFIFFFFTG